MTGVLSPLLNLTQMYLDLHLYQFVICKCILIFIKIKILGMVASTSGECVVLVAAADVIPVELLLSIPHYLHVGTSPPVIDSRSKKHQLETGGQSMMMLAGLVEMGE